MTNLVKTQLEKSREAAIENDLDLADEVIANDKRVNGLELKIDKDCENILALYAPVAIDLRFILASLKINHDLERIGDLAKNIAKRSLPLSQTRQLETVRALPRMARLVQASIKQVLDAYLQRDAAAAVDVWESDREVDEMYTGLFRATLTYMMEDPRNITPATHLLFIAKNIERMGDHATNIAEVVHFMVTGERLEGARPKGDASSYAVVSPDDATGEKGDTQA